jgi:DNA-binding transcriptional LysR family regulator
VERRQLEIFRALAEELHFTRAAARVNCVQSNVTTQVRALETELGTPLFDRLAKRVVLTDAGRRFLPYAEKVLSTLDEAQSAISQSSTPAGPLRIGAPESVLTYRLPGILRRYRQLYPRVELIFRPYWNDGLVNSLETGNLDLGVSMGELVEEPRLKLLLLRDEKILFVAGMEHPLAAKASVLPADLNGQTLLLTETGCGYRKKLDQILALQNIRPENITEFTSVEAIKECASLGMGVGLLPAIVVAAELQREKLAEVRWQGPKIDIATHLAWHRDKWISPAMQGFIDLMRDSLKPHTESIPIGCPAPPSADKRSSRPNHSS